MCRLFFSAVITVLIWGSGLSQASAQAVETGCYRIEIGSWSSGGELDELHQSPKIFRLLDEVGTLGFEKGKRIVRPVIDAGYGHPGAYWRTPEPGYLVVLWTNGFVQVQLDLKAVGSRWAGTAVRRTDVIVPEKQWPRAPVIVEPVPCP